MTNKAKIYYFTLTDEMRKREKLDWFAENKFKDIPFETIHPDKDANWLNITDNDWETLLPLANKETKLKKNKNEERAVFKLFTGGIKTNRDEWVYDFSKENLKNKIQYFIEIYNENVKEFCNHKTIPEINNKIDYSIKWSRDLKNQLLRGNFVKYENFKITKSLYRPFSIKNFYFDYTLNDVLTTNHYEIFSEKLNKTNKSIGFNVNAAELMFLATDGLIEYGAMLVGGGSSQCLPLYRYDKSGNRIENITNWGLEQFRKNYELGIKNEEFDSTNKKLLIANSQFQITKEDIFHYVYAVLHNPAYRKKYEQNLKREFPRIPFYNDFWKWAAWGKTLMDLHINYETVDSYELKVMNYELKGKKEDYVPKAKLRADVEAGEIVLDEQTTLSGIPALAWEYKLGNRSALHWILDQYKEKTPKDPTIREKFNTYKFADYKATVIDLIQRVTTVSVQTMEIVNLMETEEPHN